MMRREWLELVTEEALEPDLEIVDAHHHLWDHDTPYGQYETDDLAQDTGAGHNVVQTVFIDCGANYFTDGPEHLRPVGETTYVAGRADVTDASPGATIAVIIGHADLTRGKAVTEVLEAHVAAAGGRFRGIRHSGARAEEPTILSSSGERPADLYLQPEFQEGARALAAMDLSYEAWQYHYQLPNVVALAREVPELTIVVNHLGGPLGIGRFAGRRGEVFAETRTSLAQLAELPNVVLKVGGIGMTRYGVGWEHSERPPSSDEVLAVWGELMGFAIETFGPSRCMFESNYPVDGETCSYAVLWNAFKKVSAEYSASERADLFAETARRTYRLVGTRSM